MNMPYTYMLQTVINKKNEILYVTEVQMLQSIKTSLKMLPPFVSL